MRSNLPYTKDRVSVLEELSKMDEQDQGVASEIKKNLTKDSKKEDKELLITAIKNLPLGLIYKLAENSADLNKFFEETKELNTQWSDYLTRLSYPGEPMESIDKQKKCSLFSRLKGVFLLSKLQDLKEMSVPRFAILNKACDCGMYQAFVQRLTYFVAKIQNAKSDDKDIDKVIKLSLNDAAMLSNLYWSIGLINAANVLLNIANFCYQLPSEKLMIERFQVTANTPTWRWTEKYHHNQFPKYIAVLKEACESFYKAKLLANFPQSKALTNAIYPSTGLLTGCEFKSWDEGEKYLVKFATDLKIPLPESFCKQALRQAEHYVEGIAKLHPEGLNILQAGR